MHRKAVFSLAAVFLVVALVVPPAIVILQTNNTIYKYIIPGNSPVQGATNITLTITPKDRSSYNNAILIAVIIEIVFIILFVVIMYTGINHTHPEHQPLFRKQTSPNKTSLTSTTIRRQL